jgi:tetratricopeptide (TPR) repeat protein
VAESGTSATADQALVPVSVRARPVALYRVPLSLMLMGLLLISIQAGKPLIGLAVMLTALLSTAAFAWRSVGRRTTPALALRDEGDARLVHGDYREARALYERALAIAERELPPASPEVLVNYYSLAAVNSMLHDHVRADRYLAELLRGLNNRVPAPWTGHVAWLLRRVAHHHSVRGDHEQAIGLCQRALDLVGDAPGADDNTVRSLIDDLAWIHHHAGDYARAESLFREALAIHEQYRDIALELAQRPARGATPAVSPYRVPGPATASTTGGLDRAVAYSLLGLGWTLYERGEYGSARACFDRAAVISAAVDPFDATGRMPASSMRADGPERTSGVAAGARTGAGLLVEILRGRAAVAVTLGDYEAAAQLYARAHEALAPDDEPLQAAALHLDVGWLARCRHRFDEAETAYRDALDGIGRAHEGTATIACALYESLAELRRRQGRHRDAYRDVREALELAHECLGPEHPRVAGILAVAARVQAARGELAEADRSARKCLTLLRSRFGKDHPRIADGYVALGEVQLGRGQLGAAEQSFKRAMQLREAVLGGAHPELVEILDGQAAVLRATAREEEAARVAGRAAHLRERAGLDAA